jgi:uncharacterized protein YegP (UPF0339 family)
MSNVVHVEVYCDDAGQFRWRAKAANGEVVATSESYTRLNDAYRAARETFPDAPVLELE